MDWGQQFKSHQVAGMTADEFSQALSGAAGVQRGRPESQMLKMQRALGGGVWPHALEHVGDLTHRMMESGGRFGTEFVAPKVRSSLASLEHPYGFEREMGEQFEENKRHRGEYPTWGAIRQMGEDYATEHSKVPVYSLPGYVARSAAMNLGEMKFNNVRRNLRALQNDISNPAGYKELTNQASAVKFLEHMELRRAGGRDVD